MPRGVASRTRVVDDRGVPRSSSVAGERDAAGETNAAGERSSAVYDTKDKQIVGVYDAPLKNKENSASSPLSSLSSTVAEQIRQTLQVQDVMALSLRVPNKKLAEEEEDTDYQVKEV